MRNIIICESVLNRVMRDMLRFLLFAFACIINIARVHKKHMEERKFHRYIRLQKSNRKRIEALTAIGVFFVR